VKVFGSNKKRPEDYSGGRDTDAIKAFANTLWAANAPAPEVLELTSQVRFLTLS
jgi:hypothetical protein